MPTVLTEYSVVYKPNCHIRTFNHLQYIDTLIGRLIRDLVSDSGIPANAFNILRLQAHKCFGCECMFSIDGYNAHIHQGLCANTPKLVPGML